MIKGLIFAIKTAVLYSALLTIAVIGAGKLKNPAVTDLANRYGSNLTVYGLIAGTVGALVAFVLLSLIFKIAKNASITFFSYLAGIGVVALLLHDIQQRVPGFKDLAMRMPLLAVVLLASIIFVLVFDHFVISCFSSKA